MNSYDFGALHRLMGFPELFGVPLQGEYKQGFMDMDRSISDGHREVEKKPAGAVFIIYEHLGKKIWVRLPTSIESRTWRVDHRDGEAVQSTPFGSFWGAQQNALRYLFSLPPLQ